ncbi:hypothetical protein QQF64_022442, partial [Cirrhinus molitorella]
MRKRHGLQSFSV